MLNENKIKMMTKMAIYEKHEGRKMIKTAKYDKGDFVGLSVLKSTVATTVAFIIIAVIYVLCKAESIISNINSMDYAAVGRTIAVYYAVALIIFAIVSGAYSAYQYDKSRNNLKKYFSRLTKLERFYSAQRKK